jgi:hypothetical protein
MRTKQSKGAQRQGKPPVPLDRCQQDHQGDGPDGPDSVARGGSMGDDFIDADNHLELLLARLAELGEDAVVWKGYKLVAITLSDGQTIKLDGVRLASCESPWNILAFGPFLLHNPATLFVLSELENGRVASWLPRVPPTDLPLWSRTPARLTRRR